MGCAALGATIYYGSPSSGPLASISFVAERSIRATNAPAMCGDQPLPRGESSRVVCDGFVGNVVLKTSKASRSSDSWATPARPTMLHRGRWRPLGHPGMDVIGDGPFKLPLTAAASGMGMTRLLPGLVAQRHHFKTTPSWSAFSEG